MRGNKIPWIRVGILCVVLFLFISASLSASAKTYKIRNAADIRKGNFRKIVFALVSSAENSSIAYDRQYSYIEDIDDGRGYTAGIIGFTTGTGDLLEVVQAYITLKPDQNILEKYIPALKKAIGSDTHNGLGASFVSDWQTACKDSQMLQAQNLILDKLYLNPAVAYAKKDGLSTLGEYIYYDALVVHGIGEDTDDDPDSFNGIRLAALKKELPPSLGGDEKHYLETFLDCRTVIMQKETAHSNLSRIETQKEFISEGNYSLKLPLVWNMYDDSFLLTTKMLDTLT